ncbi:MAG: RimK family alpha-L-glutamate ligase [Actinomycetales bacterium]
MIGSLAWVTTAAARGHDEDEPIALRALARAGVKVSVVDWDDPNVDWSGFDRAILRSAWDYPDRLEEFLAWLDVVAASTDLVNPPQIVRWSLDKRYLAELAGAGLPITPTDFLIPGDSCRLPSGRFVVKPAVGAGSRDAASYGPDQHPAATRHVEGLHALGRTVLVQPFLPSIPELGEWPMVFIDGEFTHAAHKRVSLPEAGLIGELFAAEENSSHQATDGQRTVAQWVVDHLSARVGVPAYARVDLVVGLDGQPCVLEVELAEPSLFLPFASEQAIDRLVHVCTRDAQGRPDRMPASRP